MKKAIALAILGSTIILTCGFSLTGWKDALFDQIKAETIKGLESNFKHKVTIGRAEGPLLGKIVFYDVVFADFVRAEKVTVSYNLAEFALKRDIVPTISKISIEKATFKVEHNKADKWNVLSLLPPADPKAPPPPIFKAELLLSNCTVNYSDQLGFRKEKSNFAAAVNNIAGSISFKKKDLISIQLAGQSSGAPVKANGYFNQKSGDYEINLSTGKLNAVPWANYAVVIPNFVVEKGIAEAKLRVSPSEIKGSPVKFSGEFALQGASAIYSKNRIDQFSGSIKIEGVGSSPTVTCRITATNAQSFNQKLSGDVILAFRGPHLTADVLSLKIFRGNVSGKAEIDLSKPAPILKANANLAGINIAALSQNTAGLAGLATGQASISGPLNQLQGSLSTSLKNASLMGQPIEKLAATFRITNGDTQIEKFLASSKLSSFSCNGKISKDLYFDLQTRAQGIKLSGQGLLGKMEALVDLFEGNMQWQLDNKFLTSPLKNLIASGTIKMGHGQIGEQHFEKAEGKINIGSGVIQIDNVVIREKESLLTASGQTGIGSPTNLKISGEKINLADFKIVNHFLPKEARDPSGLINFAISITGELSKETTLLTFDPLLGLNLSGEASVSNAKIADAPINSGKIKITWQEFGLNISDCQLEMPNKNFLTINFQKNKENRIAGKVYGIFEAANLNRFIKKYGVLGGQVGVNTIIGGSMDDPEITASFWVQNFGYNAVFIDNIQGQIALSDGFILINSPIVFTRGNGRLELSGSVDLEPIKANKPEEIGLNLTLSIPQTDFSSVITIAEELQTFISKRFQLGSTDKKQKINTAIFSLPNIRQFIAKDKLNLFGSEKSFLKTWGKSIAETQKNEATRLSNNIGGTLSGNFHITGTVNDLSGNFVGEVKNGYIRDFIYESLKAEASLDNQVLNIKRAELSKAGGSALATGKIDFKGPLDVDISAKNMPLDVAKIAFNKDFQGTFNLGASIEGTLQNIDFTVAAFSNNAVLAGISFDKIDLSLLKDGNLLQLNNISFYKGKERSQINGDIDLDKDGKIDLHASLKNDTLGLFNLFTGDAQWLSGKASGEVDLTGNFDKLVANGSLSINDGKIYVKPIDAEIKEISGVASIQNSKITLSRLSGVWQGKTSDDNRNHLNINGSINISHILAANKSLSLNLTMAPTKIFANLPNLYNGIATIKGLTLSGPFFFDYSSGPTLSGSLELENATITLAKGPSGNSKPMPLAFNLSVGIGKNVFVNLGNANFDMSYILMNLEIQSDKLNIAGNLASPSLLGKIFIKQGSINIFGREFSLLSVDEQKTFYPYGQEQVRDNSAVFSGGEGIEGIMPKVDIMARVDVENSETDASNQITKKKVIIVSKIYGLLGSLDKERGLNILFSSFTEDKTKTPIEMTPASYSEQDIKVMLLPDFIKSLTGVSQGSSTGVDTNAILADYLASRLQTMIFSGMQRNLAQSLGLESLTLEYNFGKDLRQRMGVSNTSVIEVEKPDWRVGIAKGFFDRLFIDVRYAQYTPEILNTGLYSSFNYQLTYKITPIWSIIYYREPMSLTDLTSGYSKVTLKAGLTLWK
ncbi:MAG: translocation/assembly module TamB domain-containing protein [Candidatus Margulisiibacteriota bacterium]